MAPEPKLSDADVKRIRRRVRAGARQSALAAEYGVNRKTITRRVAQLDQLEREREEFLAATRLRRQAKRERDKLRELQGVRSSEDAYLEADAQRRATRPSTALATHNPYYDWLDRPKNLAGRAWSEARGFVRARTVRTHAGLNERKVEGMLDAGRLLDR